MEENIIQQTDSELISDGASDAVIDAEAGAAQNSDGELERLRTEVQNLRSALDRKEAERGNILSELEKFGRLFPDVSVKSLPDSVWKSVDGGIPLSAAYALYEREAAFLSDRAIEVNRRNAATSAGAAGRDAEKEYFSPDEVRAMSQREVHENYSKIKKSMPHWQKINN